MPQRRQHTRIVLLAIALLLCPVLVVAGEGSKVPDEPAAQVRQAIESHVKKDVVLKNSFLLFGQYGGRQEAGLPSTPFVLLLSRSGFRTQATGLDSAGMFPGAAGRSVCRNGRGIARARSYDPPVYTDSDLCSAVQPLGGVAVSCHPGAG